MPIKVACACGKKLAIKDELAGKKVKCPACQKLLSIPKPKVAEESPDDEWDLGDSAEEDFDDEPAEAPAKSRGGKSSASRGAVSRTSSVKGKGKKSKSSNRGLLIGVSAGGGVLVVALLAWVLWPAAPAANVAGNPPGNQEPTSAPANSTGVAPVATANGSTASNPAATTGDTAKPINSFPQVVGVHQPLTLGGLGYTVGSVAFSPDGKRLASPSQMMNVKLWDTINGQETLTLKGHTNLVNGVAFSPDGKRLASASGDKTVKLWDTASGQETLTLKGHTHIVYRVAFSPDGKRLVSGSFDKTAMVWDATNGQELLTLKGHITYVTAVAFSPDGKRLATASDKTVKLWDATSGQETLTLNGHEGAISGVAFSPDGKRLVSASNDKSLKLWDPTTGQETLTLKGHSDGLNEVAFSPDGKWLATASLDKTLKVWDVTSGQETLTLTGHGDWVTSVAFSPDGKRLASGSKDQTVKVWDVSNSVNSTGTAPSVPANALATDAGSDLKALQGDWHVVEFQSDPPAPARALEESKKIAITIAGEVMTFSGSAQAGGKLTFSIKLDPSQNPKTIDVTTIQGPDKGVTQFGLYELDGQTLRLSLKLGERPTSLTLEPGSKKGLMVWNRGPAPVPASTAPPTAPTTAANDKPAVNAATKSGAIAIKLTAGGLPLGTNFTVLSVNGLSATPLRKLPDWLGPEAPFDVQKFWVTVPPEQNAAPLYLDALYEFAPHMEVYSPTVNRGERTAAANDRAQRSLNYQIAANQPQAKPNPAERDAVLQLHAAGFQKLLEAQQRPDCLFEVNWAVPNHVLIPIAAREVVRVAKLQVERDIDQKNFDAVIRIIASQLRLSRDLKKRTPFAFQNTANAIAAMTLHDMLVPALKSPDLKVSQCDELLRVLARHEAALRDIDPFLTSLRGDYLLKRMLLQDVQHQSGEFVDSRYKIAFGAINVSRGATLLAALNPGRYTMPAYGTDLPPPALAAQIENLLKGMKPADFDVSVAYLKEKYQVLADAEHQPFAARLKAFGTSQRKHRDALQSLVPPNTPREQAESVMSAALDQKSLRGVALAMLLTSKFENDMDGFSPVHDDVLLRTRPSAAQALIALRRWYGTQAEPPPDLATVCREAGLANVPRDPFSDGPLRMATFAADTPIQHSRRKDLKVLAGETVIYSVSDDGVDDQARKGSDFADSEPGDWLFRLEIAQKAIPVTPAPAAAPIQ